MRYAVVVVALLLMAQKAVLVEHRDPRGRFRFSYPKAYGTVSAGTNDGFQGRHAAVRFGAFPAMLGGELVVTRGAPTVDLQALGGLYDSIALEVFPEALRRRIVSLLPRLNAKTFCDALGRSEHLDTSPLTLPGFSPDERAGVRRIDLLRSIDPRVVRCDTQQGVMLFVRETTFDAGGPRQHIFGAIRFLDGDISSVQLVAGSAAPPREGLVEEMAAVVRSVSLK